MAEQRYAFRRGKSESFWERVIYYCVPAELENYDEDYNRVDIENQFNSSQVIAPQYNWDRFSEKNNSISGNKFLQAMIWNVFELLVPRIKHIRKKKLKHLQASRLVSCLGKGIRTSNDSKAFRPFAEFSLLVAARYGNHEVVEEIVYTFPGLIWTVDENRNDIFKLAIIHRHENVFNLIYQMSEQKQFVSHFFDNDKNTIWHLAGRLSPPDKLNLVSGAALQMQRELQWFKAVGKLVNPSFDNKEDKDKRTPRMVFTEQHKELLEAGGKWMKDTASSYTIVASLIATVVFAAAITVPGGNDGISGLPIFSNKNVFIVFAISDAISLFTSTTSLLMFLSILTARYAEQDFLYALPKRLIIGLLTLFLSVTSMMIAFSSTLCLVFGHKKAWILFPVAALACLPITSFVSLQFPLLVELISRTYGKGIFGKKSNKPFY